MKDKHIVDLLERAPIANLSEIDRGLIEVHSKECEACRRAFEAATLAAILLKEHATDAFAPPPFFETRILAILRERAAGKEVWAFARMWRAAGALVSSMVATVALLAVLSFALPTQTNSNSNVISANSYSAEDIMLNSTDAPDDQTSDAQVLSTLYNPDEEAAK